MEIDPKEYATLIAGGGIAGYMAALSAREAGGAVAIIAGRPGASSMSSGIFHTDSDPGRVRDIAVPEINSFEKNLELISFANPHHPYSILSRSHSAGEIMKALDFFLKSLAEAGLEVGGAPDRYMLLANNLGTMNRARVALKSLAAGDISNPAEMKLAVVGIKGFPDFDAGFIAASCDALAKRIFGNGFDSISARDVVLKGFENAGNLTTTQIAAALDGEETAAAFAGGTMKAIAGGGFTHVMFPAVLGLRNHRDTFGIIAEKLGRDVFEAATLQPSVPGLRIMYALRSLAEDKGIDIYRAVAESVDTGGERITVTVKDNTSLYGGKENKVIAAGKVIIATGRFIGGGIEHAAGGHEGDSENAARASGLRETLAGVPVCYRGAPVKGDVPMKFTTPAVAEPQPVFSCGVAVDELLRPLDESGAPAHADLRCAGSVIGGYDPYRDRCGTGVAAITGYFAGIE